SYRFLVRIANLFRNYLNIRVWGFPKEKIPGPAGAPGQGFCRECGYTPYACFFTFKTRYTKL
ncbi:MAG: hypothetical protein WAT98_18020, partial [Blautia wexlerae]